jgi:succinate dehydrogenase/fumarate reductase cytochrome b subunit
MNTQFWDRLWRSAGIQFVIFLIIAYFIYGDQPKVGSSPDAVASFYDGNRMKILIATFILGMAVLYLLWFAAAIRSALRDAGQDGWGAAVTASSAALGGVLFVLMTVDAALAYKIAGSGNNTFTSGLNDVGWVCIVMTSFPRAMLIMAGTFGLWRAGIISNALFGAGVAALLLVLLGGATWATDGIWAPDGAYSRFISPIIGIAWIVVISGVLLKSSSAARTPERAAPPQW